MTQQKSSDLAEWIALWKSEGLGEQGFCKLLEAFGSVDSVYGASEKALLAAGLSKIAAASVLSGPDLALALRELERAEKMGVVVCRPGEKAYPRLLAESPYAPPVLYMRGTASPSDRKAVAMVGTRQPTVYGLDQSSFFAEALGVNGVTVVSGLARGIDRCAHRAVLRGVGRTFAVLGQGLGVGLDCEGESMIAAIVERGAVFSQFPLDAEPRPFRFPQRNRLITGLALVTIIFESLRRGGAMITAKLCLEEGRELMALPGDLWRSTSTGPNALIAAGAIPLLDVEAVLRVLSGPLASRPALRPVFRPLFESCKKPSSKSRKSSFTPTKGTVQKTADAEQILDVEERLLLSCIDRPGVHVDEVALRSGLSLQRVLAKLSLLELRALVRAESGQKFSLT